METLHTFGRRPRVSLATSYSSSFGVPMSSGATSERRTTKLRDAELPSVRQFRRRGLRPEDVARLQPRPDPRPRAVPLAGRRAAQLRSPPRQLLRRLLQLSCTLIQQSHVKQLPYPGPQLCTSMRPSVQHDDALRQCEAKVPRPPSSVVLLRIETSRGTFKKVKRQLFRSSRYRCHWLPTRWLGSSFFLLREGHRIVPCRIRVLRHVGQQV